MSSPLLLRIAIYQLHLGNSRKTQGKKSSRSMRDGSIVQHGLVANRTGFPPGSSLFLPALGLPHLIKK